ncbi:AAA family ATPase [Pseudoalteromonas sp. SaAl2]
MAEQLINALEFVLEGKELDNHFFKPIEISCAINLEKEHENKTFLSSLELLTEYDLIELDDVEFKKRDSQSEFLLSEASSGELSLLFTMSSIAGEIENNSLILIDEPELSLHPRWQLSFLDLLQSTFSNYKNCHFIIATHSPNLISSISKKDAFIVNLGSDIPELMLSKDYHNRSADFQLAKVFDAPGNNNEYLIKLAINIFSKVKANKSFDEEDLQNLDFMNGIKGSLPENDSVIELIEMLNEVYQKYGRN